MKVTIYTDGSARGNPEGPGGYGAVLQYVDKNGQLHEKELSAGYEKTTNNRMELMGVIAGLEALNRPCQVENRFRLSLCGQGFHGALDRQLDQERLEAGQK